MEWKLGFLIGIACLFVGPALADVIDVTVNNTVSGSGSLTVDCGLGNPDPNCTPPSQFLPPTETVQYSFNGTNTQPGPFSDSGSATATNAGFIQGYADQNVTSTADSIDISLSGGHSADGAILLFDTNETDTISVSFDLTQQSVVQLEGGGLGTPFPVNVGELLDSQGNVILVATNSPNSAFMDLDPGMYQLESTVSGSAMGAGPGSGGDNVQDFVLGLEASFTPVPEPQWAFVGAFLAIMLGGYLLPRRRLPYRRSMPAPL